MKIGIKGTADVVYQNMFLIDSKQPEFLMILAGDHIYKMNYVEMYYWLIAKQTDAVVSAVDIPIQDASRFGSSSSMKAIASSDSMKNRSSRARFRTIRPMRLSPWGSTYSARKRSGNSVLADTQHADAHDFGENIIPRMIEHGRVYAFKFQDANKKAVPYWQDIGTLDAYWKANMDLVPVDPPFNLYDQDWPIRTDQGQFSPTTFIFAQDYDGGYMGAPLDSIVCGGCIVSWAHVQNSVLSPYVRVLDHAMSTNQS